MINKVSDFSNKSFSNYTGPDENFKKKNIIFGNNGTGKTSLLLGLQKEFLKDNSKTLENLRLFYDDYISGNLLLNPNDRNTIKGIRVTFGEENIKIEQNIKELNQKMIDDSAIEKIENSIAYLEKQTKEEISLIFKTKKGSLRIQPKSPNLSIYETIESYKKDFDEALKLETDKSIIEKTIGDDSIERKIEILNSLEKFELIEPKIIDYDKVKAIQEEKYDDIKIPSSEIIAWLEEGLPIHQEKSVCEFCGSNFNFEITKKKIDSYVSNKKYAAETEFKRIYDYMFSFKSKIEQNIKNKTNYIFNIPNLVTIIETLENKVNNLDVFLNHLKQNYENILNIITIDINDFKKEIMQIDSCVKNINTIIEDEIDKETKKSTKIGTLVKGAIHLAISNSTLIQKNINDIKENEERLKSSLEENKRIKIEIEELKKSISVTSGFMELVNQALNDINISIELDIIDDNYYLKSTLLERDMLSVDDISQGEKNLLALLFFYFELFEDENQKIAKEKIELVVLDDPISSMDHSNRFYVLEIVKSILKLENAQIFVLTHVWEDYCNLIYNKKGNNDYASYEIRKTNKSTIHKLTKRETLYKFMFKEIYELQLKTELTSDCDYYHIPNTIRRVYEEFLLFKFNRSLAEIRDVDIQNKFKITKDDDKRKLSALRNITNVLSHRSIKTNQDILTAAQYLMKLIKDNDIVHFNTMKE